MVSKKTFSNLFEKQFRVQIIFLKEPMRLKNIIWNFKLTPLLEVPVYKNGNKVNVENISLVSNLSNIFEKNLKSRIPGYVLIIYDTMSNLGSELTKDAIAVLTNFCIKTQTITFRVYCSYSLV